MSGPEDAVWGFLRSLGFSKQISLKEIGRLVGKESRFPRLRVDFFHRTKGIAVEVHGGQHYQIAFGQSDDEFCLSQYRDERKLEELERFGVIVIVVPWNKLQRLPEKIHGVGERIWGNVMDAGRTHTRRLNHLSPRSHTKSLYGGMKKLERTLTRKKELKSRRFK